MSANNGNDNLGMYLEIQFNRICTSNEWILQSIWIHCENHSSYIYIIVFKDIETLSFLIKPQRKKHTKIRLRYFICQRYAIMQQLKFYDIT